MVAPDAVEGRRQWDRWQAGLRSERGRGLRHGHSIDAGALEGQQRQPGTADGHLDRVNLSAMLEPAASLQPPGVWVAQDVGLKPGLELALGSARL